MNKVTLKDFTDRLAETVERAGGSAQRESDGNVAAFFFPALGRGVAWRAPAGLDPSNNDSAAHGAARTVVALAEVNNKLGTIAADGRLSDEAKANDARDARRTANPIIAEHAERTRAALAEARARVATLRAPPANEDAMGQLADWECRQWIAAQRLDAMPELVRQIAQGEHPNILSALVRSPLPLPHGLDQVAPALWSEHVQRELGSELAVAQAEADRAEWLATITAQGLDAATVIEDGPDAMQLQLDAELAKRKPTVYSEKSGKLTLDEAFADWEKAAEKADREAKRYPVTPEPTHEEIAARTAYSDQVWTDIDRAGRETTRIDYREAATRHKAAMSSYDERLQNNAA